MLCRFLRLSADSAWDGIDMHYWATWDQVVWVRQQMPDQLRSLLPPQGQSSYDLMNKKIALKLMMIKQIQS